MGQEASLPQEGVDEDLLEQQARAPPSSVNPPLEGATVPGASPARPKMMNRLLRGKDFEGREAARAAAEAGQMPFCEGATYGAPPQQSTSEESTAAARLGKKGASSLRTGGKALMNSMRNLSLAPSFRNDAKPKEVNDWETKWDEDDEDDSDGEEDEAPATPLRPGMDAAHSLSTTPQLPVVVTPPIAAKMPPETTEWDTMAQQDEEDEESYGKPRVEMFLPLLRVLGKGSFGKVVLVQKRVGKERGALFAMKILRKTHLVKRRQIERTRTERKVLSVVNHPFIMKLHYAFQTPDKLYLVLDYCPGGELFFHLSRFRRFPERVARFYAAELLLAIGHLHKRGIIYRDLKPENVLLDADGHVKLGDFGLAKANIAHPCEGASSMCGTPEYMAPEVLSQQGHGFCVDYWGLGMLVYEMMTGLPPWYTTDRAKLFRRLKSAPLDIPTYFSASSANCVSGLLERNPRRRLGVMGIRTAMEHDFFRSINWRALYGRRVEAPIRPCEGWSPPEGVTDEPQQDYSVMPTPNTVPNGNANLDAQDLDAATANFDNTFTRMPVETDDAAHDSHLDDDMEDQLHEDTFVGFTFDDEKDRGDHAAMAHRQRTHNAYQPQPPPS